MKWPWRWFKKKQEVEISNYVEIEELRQWDNIFTNITWANATLNGMLAYLEEHVRAHTEVGTDCEAWCIPPRIPAYLSSLQQETGGNSANFILFFVLLKTYHRRFSTMEII